MRPAEPRTADWRTHLRRATGDFSNAIAASAIVVAVALFGLGQALVHAEESAGTLLKTLLESKRPLVELWLAERRVDMHNLSHATGALFRNDEHCLKAHARCEEHLSDLLTAFREGGRFEGIALTSPQGEMILSSGRLGSESLSRLINERMARLPVDSGAVLGFLADEGRPAVVLLQPVELAKGRVLVAVIDPSSHLSPVLMHMTAAPGDEALLVRVENGRAIRMTPDRQGGLQIGGRVPPPQSVLAHLVSGRAESGVPFSALDHAGKKVVAVGAAIQGLDWWLVVKRERAELFGEIRPVLIQLALVALLCLGGIWGLLILQRQRMRLDAAREVARERQERLQALDLLSGLAASSTDIIFAKDLERRYLLFNPAAQQQSGLSLDRVLGRRDEELIPLERAQLYSSQDDEVLRTGQSLRWDVDVEEEEGRTLSVVKSPLRDAAGQICGLVGIARDITEAKQAGARLSASEARFKALFEATSVAFFIQSLESGALLDANRQALLEAGCSSLQELGGIPFGESPYSREDMLAHVARLRDAWNLGKPARLRLEWLAHQLDGTAYWQDLQLSVVALDGKPCLLGAAMNVDERKRSEQTIHKLSLALDQSPVSVLITDPQGVIEYVNAAFSKSSGYTAQEALGAKPSMIASGETARADYAAMWSALRRGEAWEGRLKNRRKNGEVYTDQVAIYPLRQRDGRVTHYVGLQQDVTESLRLQLELEQHRSHLEDLISERTAQLLEATRRAEAANASKSAFLANMSHEIRTPMNAVLGSTGLIQRDLRALQGQAPEAALTQLTRRADQIEQSARHLLGLLNDLLDLSKIEANKLQIVANDFSLRHMVTGLLDMVRERAIANRVVLEADLADVPDALHGDGMRLSQILLNLLSNAVRFTEDGRVTLRARARTEADTHWVRFEVEDDGIGISEAQQERLFRVFEQAELNTAHRFGGTGLGLAISKRLADLMGGQVGLTSRPGEGSCFSIDLPLQLARSEMPLEPVRQSDALLADLRALGPRHVLLVDDMEINQEIARDLLLDAGLQVSLADDGEAALALARQQPFDLVLMDLRMPRMGGIEATRQLRALPLHASTPVVALTAQAFDEDREACRQAGMNDHLSKPVLPELLYACLLRWLKPVEAPRSAADAGGSVPPVPQGPTPTSADEVPAVLRNLEGFDLSVAQRLLGKRMGRLPALLARFAREQGDAAARVEAAMQQGDRETAGRIAHSLKGTSASLGLRAISEQAADVERRLREGETPDLAPLRNRLTRDAALLATLDPAAG
ncbi:PAS domain S-box protein [Inhella sp.]|uniref:PAS domain-containing sensor histidine kinase n=1 Tax=Inhella sp. TaxID=1921806 RepID=UPI0035B28F54